MTALGCKNDLMNHPESDRQYENRQPERHKRRPFEDVHKYDLPMQGDGRCPLSPFGKIMMTHIDDETMALYVDQQLSAEENRLVIEHLTRCVVCTEWAVEVIKTSNDLRRDDYRGMCVAAAWIILFVYLLLS